MIEAMACGTPVLAFAGGAVEEIVSDGVNGWICRDVADMAARDRVARCLAGRRAATFVAEHFSVARMAERYLDVYERALQELSDVSARETGGLNGRRDPGSGSVLHPGDRLAEPASARRS